MQIRRIIFVSGHGITRAPIAAQLLRRKWLCAPAEIWSRGRLVQFPEPLNQKTEAVLIANGIACSDYMSEQLLNEEITEDTLVLCMEEEQRQRLFASFPNANRENTFVLHALVGDELEILNPYGGTLQTYGLCFEMLKNTINKLADLLNEAQMDLETVCAIGKAGA